MLVLLDKDIEEYSDNLKLCVGSVRMYDLSEDTIKKEILKGNVCKPSTGLIHDFTFNITFNYYNKEVQCIRAILYGDKCKQIFIGKREKYIESYLLLGYSNDTLKAYLSTLDDEQDYPDIESLLYRSLGYMLRHALQQNKRMLKFEYYFNNSEEIIIISLEHRKLIDEYQERFKAVLKRPIR